MDIMSLREYCLSLPLCTEDMPFDDVTLCFRLAGKIFALTSLDNPTPAVNLKCQPELAIELRTHYEGIQPGFHMSKRHWNTVLLDEVPTALIKDLICNSYALILSALPRQKRSEKPLADFVAPKIQF